MEKKQTIEDKLKKINELVSGMLHAEPLTEFIDPGPRTEIEHMQKAALARMYADKGFRVYLQDAVNRSIKSAAINSDDIVSLIYNKARIILLKELLQVAEKAYKDVDATMAKVRINANNSKGEENQSGDDETIRYEEGERGVLR